MSAVKYIKDTDIDECLIAETNQRIILKMGGEHMNILFLNEKNGESFLRTIKSKSRKDTFISEALSYRMNLIYSKDKNKG